MNNKVLVKFYLLELDSDFDVFIPVNELVWKIKKLVLKSASDLTNVMEINQKEYVLLNKDTCEVYHNNSVVIDTNIRNGTELYLIPISSN